MIDWIIKTFGRYKGKTKINKGSLAGKYEVYEFLGKYYEIRC